MLPLGGLFLWDWTHPSLPLPQSRSVKNGGGRSRLELGNPFLLTDYGLKGFDLKVNPGLEKKYLLVLFMSSSKSLVTYPPTKW